MKNSKIVINHDGKTTLARLYEDKKLVKEAKARCSPEDTFDFRIGAELALDRLLSKYKPGDRVRIIGDSCGHSYMIGNIMTLCKRNKCASYGDAWWTEEGVTCVRECDIEPYVEPPKPKYWSGKVVCISNSGNNAFTVGKIYEVVDGKFIDNNGIRRPLDGECVTCPEDLNRDYFADWFSKFIPLVED